MYIYTYTLVELGRFRLDRLSMSAPPHRLRAPISVSPHRHAVSSGVESNFGRTWPLQTRQIANQRNTLASCNLRLTPRARHLIRCTGAPR